MTSMAFRDDDARKQSANAVKPRRKKRRDRSPESCTGKAAQANDEREHGKLPDVWGVFESYEGYLADMVPRIGAKAVADALGISYGTVRRDCAKLGINARRGRGAPGWVSR